MRLFPYSSEIIAMPRSDYLRPAVMLLIVLAGLLAPTTVCGKDFGGGFQLSERNTEAPFCYRTGARRRWPISTGKRTSSDLLTLAISLPNESDAKGESVSLEGLTISLSDNGSLIVDSTDTSDQSTLQLKINHISKDGRSTTQKLTIRPAPPDRPLTYLADFGDDIIRIFGGPNNEFRPITKQGFDQYFRRLQAHGISRLIIWQSPFPYIVAKQNYAAQDWQRFEGQAEAILENQELSAGIRARTGFAAHAWLRQLMALRLMPELGQMISASAIDHGIRLTASFRPFEAALTKYYSIATFDEQGRFLWNFQSLCSPTVNYHPQDIGMVHYREILRQMDLPRNMQLDQITLPGVDNAADLAKRYRDGVIDFRVRAAPFPPLAAESFVLVRHSKGRFTLRRWRDLRDLALAHLHELPDVQVEEVDGELALQGISLPDDSRYLWLSQSADSTADFKLSADDPARLWAAAGNRLGRENMYFAWDQQNGQPEPTRVNGIPPDGHYHAEFQATEASIARCLAGPDRIPLRDKQLIISLGADESVEMMDFTQAAARKMAVGQLQTLLALPAFDEIFINTRSHTQLAGYLGDDGHSVRSISSLRRQNKTDIRQIGLDKAYAPRDAANDPFLRKLASDLTTVERLTTVDPGAWRAVTCQTPEPYAWRYTRNRLVADGVRQLLLDLRAQFPTTRIRAVIPPTATTIERVLTNLEKLKDDNGNPLGRDFYRRLWCSNNHIPAFGEGMAMVDLSDTNIEPVLLGTGGYSQQFDSLEMYVRECVADLSTNRNSSFRGPRSYFFEAQGSLRATDKAAARQNREKVICYLLNQTNEIGEVILYEAADWTYFLSLSDTDLCEHTFLDRCNSPSVRP